MKQFFTRIVIVVILLSWFTDIEAYDFQYGNLCYTITSIPKKTVEIAKSNINYSGRIIIPAKVMYKNREWKVTGIGDYAFMNRIQLTEIVLPSTIEYIGFASITGCLNLKSIKLPEGITLCGSALSSSGLKSISIPKGAKFNGWNSQLSNMKYLESVYFEEGVDSLFNFVFERDRVLSKIVLPNTLKYIGCRVFDGCRSLKTIKIPESVTKIESPFLDSDCGVIAIWVKWKEPIEIDDKAFPNGKYLDATLYVPKGTKHIYQMAKGWSNFSSIVEY